MNCQLCSLIRRLTNVVLRKSKTPKCASIHINCNVFSTGVSVQSLLELPDVPSQIDTPTLMPSCSEMPVPCPTLWYDSTIGTLL